MRDDAQPDQSRHKSCGTDLIGCRPGEGDAAADDHFPAKPGPTKSQQAPSAEDFPTEWAMCDPGHVVAEQQPTR